jgi:IS5 family transposase
MTYYEPRWPCDPTHIGRFRRLLGEAGVEQLLKTTIEAAVALKAVRKSDLQNPFPPEQAVLKWRGIGR